MYNILLSLKVVDKGKISKFSTDNSTKIKRYNEHRKTTEINILYLKMM